MRSLGAIGGIVLVPREYRYFFWGKRRYVGDGLQKSFRDGEKDNRDVLHRNMQCS